MRSNDKVRLSLRERMQLGKHSVVADQKLINRYWIPTLGDFRGTGYMAGHPKGD